MKPTPYTYNIALSFAQEDIVIAEAIAKALQKLKISHYLYTESVTLARNLTKNTWKVYYEDSKYALVLVSDHYKKKKWSGREWDVICSVHRPDNDKYIIPVRIDDTELPGLHPDTIFLKWANDPSAIAIEVFRLLNSKNQNLKADIPSISNKNKGVNQTYNTDIKDNTFNGDTNIGNVSITHNNK